MYREVKHELTVWAEDDENLKVIQTQGYSGGYAMAYYVLERQMEKLKAKFDPVELEEIYKTYAGN